MANWLEEDASDLLLLWVPIEDTKVSHCRTPAEPMRAPAPSCQEWTHSPPRPLGARVHPPYHQLPLRTPIDSLNQTPTLHYNLICICLESHQAFRRERRRAKLGSKIEEGRDVDRGTTRFGWRRHVDKNGKTGSNKSSTPQQKRL